MNVKFTSYVIGFAALSVINVSFAATAVDLSAQPATVLKTFLPNAQAIKRGQAPTGLVETSRQTDFNQATHIRVNQTYNGVQVFGGDAIIHMKKGLAPTLNAAAEQRLPNLVSMDGVVYADMQADLADAPAAVFTKEQAEKALQAAIEKFKASKSESYSVSDASSKLMVYLDNSNKAHYAFYISFFAKPVNGTPANPVYILDAATFATYKTWNDLKTASALVKGGGVGGNPTMGKKIYDGLTGNRPVLEFTRDDVKKTCTLRSSTVTVNDKRTGKVPSFRCDKPDTAHNNVYWNSSNDEANGGYSPNNDGVYSNQIVREMYKKWMNLEMLTKNGKPQLVTFYTHAENEGQNAYYINGTMTFGEGDEESYPVVAPSVVAHEMSHGFTEQHSNLVYNDQSGGLNESFSDMADKAVEYYTDGKNNWEIDPEVLKPGGRLLRWMDTPTKDCDGRQPGDDCSIDHYKDYSSGLNVHYSSGLFNKAFTLISAKWNTRKAFEVMTQANVNYWTANTSFASAACGVIKATRDYKYDEKTVRDAFAVVGVKPRC